jgi:hypothetical protein
MKTQIRNSIKLALLLFTTIVLFSCSKSDDAPATETPITVKDIYVCGSTSNGTIFSATIWKNGVATNLTDGIKNALGSSVFVSGTDVYVSGREYNSNSVSVAKVWKNGISVSLFDGTKDAIAFSVFVVGSTVYAAGFERNNANKRVAKIWKDGIALPNFTNITQNSAINSIFVVGDNVYSAGYEGAFAKIWKNGVLTNSPAESDEVFESSAQSIVVLGSDVYSSGYVKPINGNQSTAIVWKNGIPVAPTITNGTKPAEARAIKVVGSDVYTAGLEGNVTNYFA